MDQLAAFRLRKVGGQWLLWGDQRPFDMNFQAHTVRSLAHDNNTTGLELWLENRNTGNDAIDRVVLTGPGLGAGITYEPQAEDPSGPYRITASSVCSFDAGPYCVIGNDNDAAILAIPDNAAYTVTTYNGTEVLGAYVVTLPRRPYTNAELATVAFPEISSPTSAAFMAYNGGPLAVHASVPATVNRVRAEMTYNVGSEWFELDEEKTVMNGAAVFDFTTAGNWVNNTYLDMRLSYKDAFRREVMTTTARHQ